MKGPIIGRLEAEMKISSLLLQRDRPGVPIYQYFQFTW